MNTATDKKELIREMLQAGMSQNEIAKKLGMVKSTISYYVSKYELETFISKTIASEIKKGDIVLLSSKGMSSREIGKELGVSFQTILRYAKRFGIVLPKYPKLTKRELINANGLLKCTKCNTEKHPSEFYETEGIFNSYCKVCTNNIRVAKLRELKRLAVEYKGGKCQKCGYCKSNAALDFHHRDRTQKDFKLSGNLNKFNDVVKAELDKCDLLCSNCHREVHEEMRESINGIEALM